MLIITQKVNKHDPVLGFFHDWIIEFAKQVPKITVICLEEGEYSLPSHVRIISLGKEKGYGKVRLFLNLCRALLRLRYEKIFVHMNPEYIVLFGWFWRLSGKDISLWYTHKAVNLKLKIAVFFSHRVFSASKDSFRFPTKKLQIMGHGIDSKIFYPAETFPQKVRILSVGRISPTKNYEPLLEAVALLKQEGVPFRVDIAGGPVSASDEVYFTKIKTLCHEKGIEDIVSFLGPVSFRDVPSLYRTATIFVNLSNTGSLDKAVLEAMATGLSVVTSNEAFKDLIDSKYLTTNNPIDIKSTIQKFFHVPCDLDAVSYVRKNHSLTALFSNIIDTFLYPKKICFFGIYDSKYSRNRVMVQGFKENGYDVIECVVDPRQYSGFKKFTQLYKEWKKIRHHNFSFCIAGFPGHSVVWFAAILFGRKKVIFDFFVSLYNSDIEDRAKSRSLSLLALYAWFLDYFSLLVSKRILIDTYAHRDFISKKFLIREKKFQVLYVGSDERVVYPKENITRSNKKIVHFHGTNTPLQGFSVIREASKILESDSTVEFHIYGFPGKDTSNMKFFPRFQYEQMADVLSRADIVLGIFGTTPKADKVIPNKVFEGLAAGKPVITMKSEAIQEIFENGKNIIYSEPGNAKSLADQILILKQNTVLAKKIASEGYELFQENFTSNILIKNLLQYITS